MSAEPIEVGAKKAVTGSILFQEGLPPDFKTNTNIKALAALSESESEGDGESESDADNDSEEERAVAIATLAPVSQRMLDPKKCDCEL